MSLSRLSAGAGYRYLLRHTACGDACRQATSSLTAYYSTSGYPVGRWHGRGLAGLDDGRGLVAGSVVAEDAMAALYGRGHDPVSGQPLGKAYPAFRSVDERIAEALAALPATLSPSEAVARRAEIETAERARPARGAVAGFDLTFTMPKSASVLWALGGPAIQEAVMEAHREAVAATLGLVEDRFLHTRVGAQGCAQVSVRGMVAAAFDHWDTRTGDPNLHTHVVVANKVQAADGRWRSLDSKALHHAAVALSEVYDDLLADAVSARLPVAWAWRDRGERRSPAFEIEGLDDNLLAAFSRRAGQIAAAVGTLIEDFRSRQGRDPSRREVLQLRQQATLATRPEKSVRPLGELIARWRGAATGLTGRTPEQIVDGALRAVPCSAEPVDIAPLVQATLTGIAGRRSTWTRANLLAEVARASRHLRFANPTARLDMLDAAVASALNECTALDPPEPFETPRRYRRMDGTSVFARPDEHAFTTVAVLDAESRLVRAAESQGAPLVGDDVVGPVVEAAAVGMPGMRGLSPDQSAAVVGVAGSGRLLDVLVGPAGSGKTRALRSLRVAWERAYGPQSVVGLAPSATAASELSAALAMACENTTKWLHESNRLVLHANHLLIVDEASMVTTEHLDRLVGQAAAAGAKVVLVGDHQQLDAVGAGGAFALLAESRHAQHLTGLWRFDKPWEAEASRALRTGRVEALDFYAAHARLVDGPSELMLEAAYNAWAADVAAGRSAVLLAVDRGTVAVLNERAHLDRVAAGLADAEGIPLADGATAGRGDLVVTRRNRRDLVLGETREHVRNGALWHVVAVHEDGGVDVVPGDPAKAGRVRLPADYVRQHLELGYAATIHRAQGMTVDCGHVVATDAMSRQSLYVAMTRGRQSNHAYVVVDPLEGSCASPTDGAVRSGRDVLGAVLSKDGAELSATATLRRRQDHAGAPRRLGPIRELMSRAALDPEVADAVGQIDDALRARARSGLVASGRTSTSRTTSRSRPEGIHR